ncbi:hypothetical protein LTR37_001011 [Vermiconidia calcicola]|uniref:Uncharacterized protein n=1 Tax=Vermiconidia calcicola TaxID=1690605 RepID=A0ACC3NYA0_9PEZI|nr:hypothetical protein LTR37_001011 [Vermiconidia calcicola]
MGKAKVSTGKKGKKAKQAKQATPPTDDEYEPGTGSDEADAEDNIDREPTSELDEDNISLPADEDANTPPVEDVYLSEKGTNRCKMEQWMKSHAELMQEDRAASHKRTEDAARRRREEVDDTGDGTPHDLEQATTAGSGDATKDSRATLEYLQRFPRRRNLQVVAHTPTTFRVGAQSDDLTGNQSEFAARIKSRASAPGNSVMLTQKAAQMLNVKLRQDVANRIAATFKDILDRVPVEISSLDKFTKGTIFRQAIFETPGVPDGAVELGKITISKEKLKDLLIVIRYPLLSSPSQKQAIIKRRETNLSVSVDDVPTEDADIPDPSARFSFEVPKELLADVNAKREGAGRPEVSSKRLEQAIKALQWIASILATAHGSEAEIYALRSKLMADLNLPGRMKLRSVTNELDLTATKVLVARHGLTHGLRPTIHPSTLVLKRFPQLPKIRITASPHLLHLAKIRVSARVQETYHTTGSKLEAWLDGCRLADAISLDGLAPFIRKCVCSTEASKTQKHPCDWCLSIHDCFVLQPPTPRSSLRLCQDCVGDAFKPSVELEATDEESANEDESAGDMQLLAKATMDHDSMRNTYRKEIKLFNLTKDEERADRLDRFRRHEKKFSRVVRDLYLDIDHDPHDRHGPSPFKRTAEAHDPYQPVFDGILPVYLLNGRVRYHDPENVGRTMDYVNLMKWIHPPIVLRIIFELLQCPIDDHQTRSEMVDRLNHLHIIRSGIPWRKIPRLAMKITEDGFERFRATCHSGIANPDSGLDPRRVWIYKHTRVHAWLHRREKDPDLPQLNAVKSVVDEMQQMKVTLPTINDTPYPFAEGPQGIEYDWVTLYKMLAGYLNVIILHCNNRWNTDLNVPVLIVVLFYCVLNRDDPDWAEPLGLPLTPWRLHALALSFGKRVHVFGMDGPLPHDLIDSFTRLSEFVWENCNIEAETWTSNNMVGGRDDLREEVVQHFKAHFRVSNPAMFPEKLPKLPSKLPVSSLGDIEGHGDDESEGSDTGADDDDNEYSNDYDALDDLPFADDDIQVLQSLTGAAARRVGQQNEDEDGDGGGGGSESDKDEAGKEKAKQPPRQTFAAIRRAWQEPLLQQTQPLPHLKNLKNLGNTCYASTAFQVAHNLGHINRFVRDENNFKFKSDDTSGRRPQDWMSEPNFRKMYECTDGELAHMSGQQMQLAKRFVEELRKMFSRLDPTQQERITPTETRRLFEALRAYDNEWDYRMNDSAILFKRMMVALIYASEDSEPHNKGGLDKLKKEHNELVERQQRQPDLGQDSIDYYTAYAGEGRMSLMLGSICIQNAKEWKCPDCNLVTRQFEHEMGFTLAFPEGTTETQKFDFDAMLEHWTVETLGQGQGNQDNGISCPIYGGLHDRTYTRQNRITICPEILMVHFSRRMGGGKYRYNHVDLPEYIDMHRFINGVTLPSEEQQRRHTVQMQSTIYRLEAVDIFIPSGLHYISCSRTDSGWVAFDDGKWPNPPITRHPQLYIDEGSVPYWVVYVQQKDLTALPENYFVLKAEDTLEGRVVGADPLRPPANTTAPPNFPCPYAGVEGVHCKQVFNTELEANHHAQQHARQNQICKTCRPSRQFHTETQLADHYREVHMPSDPAGEGTTGAGGEKSGGRRSARLSGKRTTDERPRTSDSTTHPPSKNTRLAAPGPDQTPELKKKGSKLMDNRVGRGLKKLVSRTTLKIGEGVNPPEGGRRDDDYQTTADGSSGVEGSKSVEQTTPMTGVDVTDTGLLSGVAGAIKEGQEGAMVALRQMLERIKTTSQAAEAAHQLRMQAADCAHMEREQAAVAAHQRRMQAEIERVRAFRSAEIERLRDEVDGLRAQEHGAQLQIRGLQDFMGGLMERRERAQGRLDMLTREELEEEVMSEASEEGSGEQSGEMEELT